MPKEFLVMFPLVIAMFIVAYLLWPSFVISIYYI